MSETERVINDLNVAKLILCNPQMLNVEMNIRIGQAITKAIDLLKEKEAEWIYGEDETGVDGWHCSKCDFFEPWFYDFDDDINFIKRYKHCPKCGRRMTSYTGKLEEEQNDSYNND